MKKIFYPIFLFMAANAFSATVITESQSLTLTQYGEYIMGNPFLTITHNYTGARHYSGYIDLNGQLYTQLVIDAKVSSGYFGFNGATFKGQDPSNMLNISTTNNATAVHLMTHGFIVDNCMVTMDLGTKQQNDGTLVTVKNNGVLNWSNVPFSGNRLRIVLGTEGSATDTNSQITLTSASKVYTYGRLTVYNGSFSLTGYERLDLDDSIIHALSQDSTLDYFTIQNEHTFTIGAGITNKIWTNNNVVLFTNATLELNSTDVIMKTGGLHCGVYFAQSAPTGNLVLGADNTLNNISAASGTPHTLNITLNEHTLTVVENIDFNTISVNLTDFGNEMFRFKSENEDALILSHITAWHNDVLLEDITIKNDGEYKYLFSESVPEPAFFAAILGFAALGFAFRRR